MDRAVTRLALALLAAACLPTPLPSATPVALQLHADDDRLYPPLREIAANRDWTEDQSSDLIVTRVVPSFPHLCVEVRRPGLSNLNVAVDVDAAPWEVATVALGESGPEGPPVTYERAEDPGQGDWCAWTLMAAGQGPFPAHAADIDVVSVGPPVEPAIADALRAAVHASPERFGIDRSTRPEVWLLADEERAGGLRCLELRIDFRAIVHAGLRPADDGWEVTSARIVRQALSTPLPMTTDPC